MLNNSSLICLSVDKNMHEIEYCFATILYTLSALYSLHLKFYFLCNISMYIC